MVLHLSVVVTSLVIISIVIDVHWLQSFNLSLWWNWFYTYWFSITLSSRSKSIISSRCFGLLHFDRMTSYFVFAILTCVVDLFVVFLDLLQFKIVKWINLFSLKRSQWIFRTFRCSSHFHSTQWTLHNNSTQRAWWLLRVSTSIHRNSNFLYGFIICVLPVSVLCHIALFYF